MSPRAIFINNKKRIKYNLKVLKVKHKKMYYIIRAVKIYVTRHIITQLLRLFIVHKQGDSPIILTPIWSLIMN